MVIVTDAKPGLTNYSRVANETSIAAVVRHSH
jgi:hypothetical protein